jgi:hypothetical protein
MPFTIANDGGAIPEYHVDTWLGACIFVLSAAAGIFWTIAFRMM